MDFGFSPEQLALRDLAREVLARESPPARVRGALETGERGDEVWKTLAQVGLLGITVPEEHGGAGGDLVDLVLVLEEAGRAALPEPLVETLAVAAPLLARHGPTEVREEWLPRIAAGEAVATVVLDGAPLAPAGDRAHLAIVEEEGEVHVRLGDGARGARVATGSGRAVASYRRGAGVAGNLPAGKVAALADGAGAAAECRALAAAGTAAVLDGVALRLLELTLEHVKGRHQFGRPVGSFQAVKHKLASVHVAVESSRSATWYAAYALARGLDDRFVAASAAKACANRAQRLANLEALQCHGGIGFTWEHDLHLWLKLGLALEAAYGGSEEHHALLAESLFGSEP